MSIRPRIPLLAAAALAALAGGRAHAGPADSERVDFNREVRPILAANCYECHGPDEESRATDLRFDRLDEPDGRAFVPGDPDGSPMLARMRSHDEYEVMPPPESKRRPTPAQIETLRRWIAEGAATAPHWAFVPPRRPAVPAVIDRDWPRTPVDAFVLKSLERGSPGDRSPAPRPDAEPGVLARRLSLALTGLPLSPERLDRFGAEYETDADAAVAALVDERLASPAYGERFAWGWLDAARYADTNGYQADRHRIMWPWRDWLVRALNENRPFDELTRQMLAGDELAAALSPADAGWRTGDWLADPAAADRLLATGFLRNHRYDTGSGTIPAESRFENAADRLETVGTVWMGLTLQCARCHTHKFDPVEHREYYALLSYFDDVPEVGSALGGASHPYVLVPSADQRAELLRLRARRDDLARRFAAACDAATGERAAWERSLGETKDDPPRVARGLRHRYAAEAIRFDGETTRRKPSDAIELCRGSEPWTISFWFKPESDGDAAIFSSVEQPEKDRKGIQADWVDGRVRVRHVCRWVHSYVEFRSRERLAVGEWRHVTFRSDGRMQGLAYSASLDGDDGAMERTHGVTNDGAGDGGNAPLVLGGSVLMPSFTGALRDLRFYDRDLQPDEIRSLADPRPTAALAAIPADRRTAGGRETLRLAFAESDAVPPAAARLREERFAADAALAEFAADLPTTMVMRDDGWRPTPIRKAGQYDDLGEPVDRGTPAFLPPLPDGPRGRRELADWLLDPGHPLTARVAVNRIWQTLWGRGLVDRPDNFGVQCPEPEHAALLDWLAVEYRESGWDTKALVRLIVTSRVYRQASDAPPERWALDPNNADLARGPRFRLPVAAVRDQALALSGRLDRTIGGPPVLLGGTLGKDGEPVDVPFARAETRRTLYSFWKRNSPHPLLAVFDVADRNRCEVRAIRTNTPLQALVTLNEPGFAASAAALGRRARDAAPDRAGRLRWLWRACTGRRPDAATLARLGEMLDGYRDLAADSPDAEDRAWAALGNVVLNLDATLTLE